ncbi:MAG: protein phosphatase 2C domain-containing protein [Defluviitaleaceae bacterium]|nr:protein phosphatase 2C domain-containing protein [Defluviitaleaceae bacterium]
MSIYTFCGGSQTGKSHESKNIVCQDALCHAEGDGFFVVAVADGLGSCKHSDIASRMATAETTAHCAKNICRDMQDGEIISIIETAFDNANFSIKHFAGEFLNEYDTTLTLAVYINGTVFFGHAGDSGIIALRRDGIFEAVTQPQLGSGYGKERAVYPLAAKAKWVFGKYEHTAKAIFLMTDGVLNKAVPPLLHAQKYKLDHAYLFYLYDNLCKNPNVQSWISQELSNIPPQEVNYDDKTLAAVMCNSLKIKLKPKSYYNFPSNKLWNTLLEKQNNELY